MSLTFDYDLVVLGSGPAGQRAAIQAAKLGKRVAVVEKQTSVGGACINVGTIPSKTLREAVLHLSGWREKALYGASYTVKQHITLGDLLFRTDHVMRHEHDVTRHQLARNGIETIHARGSLVDPHTVRLDFVAQSGQRDVRTRFIVVATGTHATRSPHIPFDGRCLFTSDDLLSLDRLPRTLAVIGGGVIGCEYAAILAALGVRVTLIDKQTRLLGFVDEEIADALTYHMRQNRVNMRLGEAVKTVEPFEDERGEAVRIVLESGKHIVTEKALYAIGRTGNTADLKLDAAGLEADSRGRLKVNEHFQTAVPHIYAVGDLIGFPALASVSMEQGRLAACHAFGIDAKAVPALFPYGIYTIPEISMVGPTEDELTKQGIPYEVGKAHYKEIARGQIMGDTTGVLKLIFHLETHALLAVHILGEGASELIHIGQAVLAFGGKVEYFVNTVFNYPTLAECYKTAAFDGLNRLRG
ncbi:MAG: Si-specific NAD(P)(+) transhydrogenase [Polyangiaceae bacterium]